MADYATLGECQTRLIDVVTISSLSPWGHVVARAREPLDRPTGGAFRTELLPCATDGFGFVVNGLPEATEGAAALNGRQESAAQAGFLQIGEHKYGKPILDRIVRPETSLEDGQKAVLLSMDSTLRSNLSVGMPLDLAVIRAGECRMGMTRRIEPGDADFMAMSQAWSQALRDSFTTIEI